MTKQVEPVKKPKSRNVLMAKITINKGKAGFWIRFAATWIDVFIVWAIVKLASTIFNQFSVYVPLELTVVIIFVLYSILLVGSFDSKFRISALNVSRPPLRILILL